MKRTSLPQMVFEMALLRLADVRPFQSINAMIETINQMEGEETSEPPAASQKTVQPSPGLLNRPLLDNMGSGPADSPRARAVIPKTTASVSSRKVQNLEGESLFRGKDIQTLWDQAQTEICRHRNSFGYFFEHCEVSVFPPARLRLEFADSFTRDLVDKDENKKILLETVVSVFGGPVEVELGVREYGNSGISERPPEPVGEKTAYNERKITTTRRRLSRTRLTFLEAR